LPNITELDGLYPATAAMQVDGLPTLNDSGHDIDSNDVALIMCAMLEAELGKLFELPRYFAVILNVPTSEGV
jgi:hypothetical protein